MVAVTKRSSADADDKSERAREMRREFGRVLKTWREARGLTQADVAASLGLKYYSFVSQVENGIGRIPQSLYGPWADALRVEREEFAWTALAALEPSLYELLCQHDPGRDERLPRDRAPGA